jgi:hypothetical protein
LLLKIPIEIYQVAHYKGFIWIHDDRVETVLPLSDGCITSLVAARLVFQPRQPKMAML